MSSVVLGADVRRPRILCVDDEPNVLEGLVAFLRRRYRVVTASSGAAGLVALNEHGPFDVVISDMRMPGMDGAAFLMEVRLMAPDTTRVLLTGHADVSAAIAAVNRGGVFRFLTKPCPPAELLRAVDEACEQARLRRAERELVEQTLRGTVQVLTESLALVAPARFAQAQRMRPWVRQVGEALGLMALWELELAALLSGIGRSVYAEGHPEVPPLGKRVLARIPRLERVAEMVARQDRDVTEVEAARAWRERRLDELGGAILRAVRDLDRQLQAGVTPEAALDTLSARRDVYHPAVLEALREVELRDEVVEEVALEEVEPDRVLHISVFGADGEQVPAGLPLSPLVRARLEALSDPPRRVRVRVAREPVAGGGGSD